MSKTIHGFADGDTVTDTRDGNVGTVRFMQLTAGERAEGGYAEAEVTWAGQFGAVELTSDLARNIHRTTGSHGK